MQPVPGLCKVVTRKEIAAADWSLTPGRYVGVAAAEVDEDFDFEQTITEIHEELAGLNSEAAELAGMICQESTEMFSTRSTFAFPLDQPKKPSPPSSPPTTT